MELVEKNEVVEKYRLKYGVLLVVEKFKRKKCIFFDKIIKKKKNKRCFKALYNRREWS